MSVKVHIDTFNFYNEYNEYIDITVLKKPESYIKLEIEGSFSIVNEKDINLICNKLKEALKSAKK